MAVHAALALMVVLPVATVRVPLLGDYLNHLARIAILSRIDDDPNLQQFYLDRWKFVPYFGMDLPVLGLAHFMSIYAAGRVFVCLCVLMPPAACAVLHYVLHRRASLVPIAAYLISYNYLLARGFLAYLVSAGLAIMLFAAWVATERWPRGRRAALFALACLALYLCHAFAFLSYGVLIAGYEAGQALRSGEGRVGARLARLSLAASQALPTLVVAWWTSAGTMVGAVTISRFGTPSLRLADLLSLLYFPGNNWINAIHTALPVAALALARRVSLVPPAWPAAAFAGLVSCVMPHVLMDLWGADLRLPPVFTIVLIASASLRMPWHPSRRALCVAAIFVLVGMRTADAGRVLRGLDEQVASLRQTLASLPEGARLLVVDADEAAPGRLVSLQFTGHLGMVATIDRDAFVPFLFTGVTLVQIKPAYRDYASPVSFAISLAQLRAPDPPPSDTLPPYGLGGQMYWVGWRHKFTYALIIHFGQVIGDLPSALHEVASGDIANLYAITGS